MMRRNNLGRFIKGTESVGYWLGKKRSPETNQKISLKLKGRSLSEETKNKMLGRIPWNKNKKGAFKHTLEWRLELSKKYSGKNHWNWHGGISDENERVRKSLKYQLWREAIFKRDNYKCQICGINRGWNKDLKKRIIIQADHIQQFALHPNLRFELLNGRTLCVECHKKTPTWGNKPQVAGEVMPL